MYLKVSSVVVVSCNNRLVFYHYNYAWFGLDPDSQCLLSFTLTDSEETARSNAKHFLEEQEKIFQIGLQQKVKDTPEDRSDDEVVISGKGSHHEVSYGPEWDETLPKV